MAQPLLIGTRELFSPRALAGKTAIVTGGNRGIGRSIVIALAACGARVLFTYNSSREQAEHLVSTLESEGALCSAFPVNFTRSKDALNQLQTIDGFEQIDILVNNVGTVHPLTFLASQVEDFATAIEVNLMSTYVTAQLLAPYMIKRNFGRIINISSVAGTRGTRGMTAYSASKAAIEGFTRSLAADLGIRNVTVNSIAPGFVPTDLSLQTTPVQTQDDLIERSIVRRAGRTEDVARLAVFLCSESSGFITAQNIVIDGGLTMQIGLPGVLGKRG